MSKVLGRGLASLLDEKTKDEVVTYVNIDNIVPSHMQPRRLFSEDELKEMSQSIVEYGIIQPLIVRELENKFEIIAGERRWRAAKLAKLTEVPILVKKATDKEVLEFALLENIQRQDLTALEEAHGYVQLINQFGYTQDQLSNKIGKSRSHIANTIRLLNLSPKIRRYVEEGVLSAGHARCLLTNSKNAEELAERCINEGLSVRQLEALVRVSNNLPSNVIQPTEKRNSGEIQQMEKLFSQALNMPVKIQHHGNRGSLTIFYQSLTDFDILTQKLT